MGTPAPEWSPMTLGSLSLRTVAGSAVPRGSGGGYSCSWVPLALLHRSASGWWIFGRSLLLWTEMTVCLCACRPVSLGRDALCAMNNVWLPGLVCNVYHSFSNHPLLSWFVARCCCMRVFMWVFFQVECGVCVECGIPLHFREWLFPFTGCKI